MQMKIELSMDNAAFGEAAGMEAARILRKLADRIEYDILVSDVFVPLQDVNGNRVGYAEVEGEEDDDEYEDDDEDEGDDD